MGRAARRGARGGGAGLAAGPAAAGQAGLPAGWGRCTAPASGAAAALALAKVLSVLTEQAFAWRRQTDALRLWAQTRRRGGDPAADISRILRSLRLGAAAADPPSWPDGGLPGPSA